MTYELFIEMADRLWEEIPSEYKQGLHGIHVFEYLKPDPEEPGLLRLGEYHDPGYPSVLGGYAGIGRHIALFYGSFRALADEDPHFDWEGEIWETLVHELRHHLESLAWRDDLVREDIENLRRYREG